MIDPGSPQFHEPDTYSKFGLNTVTDCSMRSKDYSRRTRIVLCVPKTVLVVPKSDK